MIFVDGCMSGRLTFLGVNIWLWYMMLPYLGYGSFVENLTSHGSQGTLISSLLRDICGFAVGTLTSQVGWGSSLCFFRVCE